MEWSIDMNNLTELERLFLELLRELDEQRRQDVIRIMEALRQSTSKDQ